MNKKILSAMLSVAILFAAGSAFVSCKDYDDDIKNLQTQIDGLKHQWGNPSRFEPGSGYKLGRLF